MTPEPTTPAWSTLTHEVRAEIPGPVTAATLAAFAIIVPDHAEVKVLHRAEGHQLVATWPHESIDDVGRPAAWFDVGADIRQRPVDYALSPPPPSFTYTGSDYDWNPRHIGHHAPADGIDVRPLEGCAQTFAGKVCEHQVPDHAGPHVFRPATAAQEFRPATDAQEFRLKA